MIHNPEDPSARADLQLMDLVLSVLAPLIGHTTPYNASSQLFQELRNVAKRFVENKMLQQTKRTKREYDSVAIKDENFQPLGVVSDPVTGVPQAQPNPDPDFVVSSLLSGNLSAWFAHTLTQPFVAQPFQPSTQQYLPQSFDSFGDGSFAPAAQSMMPLDDTGFPTMGFDAFMFSESFQWDLANLVRMITSFNLDV